MRIMSIPRADVYEDNARLRRQIEDLTIKQFPEVDGYQTEHFWAAFFQLDLSTFRQIVSTNKIPYGRFGQHRMIRKESIEAYLDTTVGVPYHGRRKKGHAGN